MANWANPTIASNYVTFVDDIKNRDNDAISLMGLGDPTSPPYSAIKLVRTPVKFQEYRGAITGFVDLVLSVAGGGTGANNTAGAISGLGLGTIAVQNYNNVNITGGLITDVNLRGTINFLGTTLSVSTNTPGNHAIAIFGQPGTYTIFTQASAGVGSSYGMLLRAGTNGSDSAFYVQNAASTVTGLIINGFMTCYIPHRLVIPVGVDKWA